MSYSSVKDSGKREDFSTGSKRDTREGKGRFDLMSPIVLERDAKHLQNGAVKYGDRNWELGQPLSRFMDSALRHINKFIEGHRDEDHLSAARWNLGCAVHIEEMIKRGTLDAALNDLPSYIKKPETLEVKPTGEPKVRYFKDVNDSIPLWRFVKGHLEYRSSIHAKWGPSCYSSIERLLKESGIKEVFE